MNSFHHEQQAQVTPRNKEFHPVVSTPVESVHDANAIVFEEIEKRLCESEEHFHSMNIL